MDKLERIASRLARAVGSEESPDRILESASLVAELEREFEASQGGAAPDSQLRPVVVLAAAEPDEKRALWALLDRLDCAVLEVATGADALAVCGAEPGVPDLLVTGMSLPDMAADELAARIAAVHPALAVLSVSGVPGEDVAHELADLLEIEHAS